MGETPLTMAYAWDRDDVVRLLMDRGAKDQLYELLDKVPESARPALLRAISVSEDGYMKALESLLNRPK